MKYEEYSANGNTRERSPAEIESDLADIRHEMSGTLERLEERFSPRSVIDTVFSRTRGMSEGSGQFVTNLGTTVRDNPVPTLLLAAGVASLFAAQRRGPQKRTQELELVEEETGAGGGVSAGGGPSKAEALKSKARQLGGSISHRASTIGERASAFGERAGERAGAFRGRAAERGAVARDRMRGAVHQAREHGSQTLQDQPLVVVGLGLALGAAFGAAMPVSERERRAMGGRGQRWVDRTREAVGQGMERAKEVTHNVTQSVTQQVGSVGSEAQQKQAQAEGQPGTSAASHLGSGPHGAQFDRSQSGGTQPGGAQTGGPSPRGSQSYVTPREPLIPDTGGRYPTTPRGGSSGPSRS